MCSHGVVVTSAAAETTAALLSLLCLQRTGADAKIANIHSVNRVKPVDLAGQTVVTWQNNQRPLSQLDKQYGWACLCSIVTVVEIGKSS